MIDIREVPVLIVDDDPVFCASLRAVLEQVPDEWACHAADSVQDAKRMMSLHAFDLAIVDVHLPDGTAADVIRAAGQMPCLLCTQDAQEPTFRKMFDDPSVSENIVGYLTKPLQPGAIWSLRAGLQIGYERQMRNRTVADATAALEEERRHIAQNLHDAMGALLTQLNWIFIGIERAARKTALDPALNAELAEFCKQGKQLVSSAHIEVSEVITQLRPEIVSVAGLRAGLEDMIWQWEKTAPTVRFEHALAPEIDKIDARKIGVLYRLVQEGITNAMRHTNPEHVKVGMTCDAHRIRLTVDSEGAVKEKKDDYALTVLRERTTSLGGILHFVCDTERGKSSLLVTIPK